MCLRVRARRRRCSCYRCVAGAGVLAVAGLLLWSLVLLFCYLVLGLLVLIDVVAVFGSLTLSMGVLSW